MHKSYKDLKKDALSIFLAGLKAVNPADAIRNHVKVRDDLLTLNGHSVKLQDFDNIYVFGAGKASGKMALALEELLEDKISGGVVIVKNGYTENLKRVECIEAAHPVPDENGHMAAQKIYELLSSLDERSLVLFALSGGGSALLPLPVEEITLEEKIVTTDILLKSGASIKEINAIRKHLSKIKGGRLLEIAFPAKVITLVVSDVVRDKFDVIASGPTSGDPSTFAECMAIIKKYDLEGSLPASVVSYLKKGVKGKRPETPGCEDPIFKDSFKVIIGSNIQCLQGALKEAVKLGYNSIILSSFITGDTGEAARFHVSFIEEIKRTGNPTCPPACLISGGETTLKVTGKGKGGRNQEFVLAAAIECEDIDGICILSGGTDGTDGPTDAAGAFCNGETIRRALNKGLNPKEYLDNNDSYHFFKKLGDLLITGPTNTNVMDMRIILVI